MDEGLVKVDPYGTSRVRRSVPLALVRQVYWQLAGEVRRGVHDRRPRAAVPREAKAPYVLAGNREGRASHIGEPGDDERIATNGAGPGDAVDVRPPANPSIVKVAFRVARRLLDEAEAALTPPGSPSTQDDRVASSTSNAEADAEEDLAQQFLRDFGRETLPQEEQPSVEPHNRTGPSDNGNGRIATIQRPPQAIAARPPEWPTTPDLRRPHEGLPRNLLVRHSVLPMRRENGTLELAVSRMEDVETARALADDVGAHPRVYLVDRTFVDDGLVELFRDEDQREIARGHAERCPELSAQQAFTAPQLAVAALFFITVAASLYLFPVPTLVGLVAACTVFYIGSSAYKMFVVAKSLVSPGEVSIDQSDVAALDERTLPTYTLLLPLYREANVVQHLLAGIDALDYPRDRLDVKLLLEPDDAETRAAVEHADLPAHYQLLVVPAGGPKSKPKALNFGLLHARGELCTIYDAEDRPEPDQLKKAVIAFRRLGVDVGCVQAKLNFYNPNQNLLTSWFTADYSQWFDLYLPGLTGAGAPIPLGGTSNHFPTALLRELGGWDPYNVTEDADLGIRLARAGLRTAMIDSVTYEEANSRLGNWLRQRSHWIKGYMLTWLVHMRNPIRLWRELGTHGFFSIQMTVAGSVFGYFANPVFWVLIAAWYTAHWAMIQTLYPAPVLYLSVVCLFFANFVFVYVAMAGCVRREFYEGVKYTLLIPAYWALMTVAALHALYQLVVKPHYWEKTVHGLGLGTSPEALVAAPSLAE